LRSVKGHFEAGTLLQRARSRPGLTSRMRHRLRRAVCRGTFDRSMWCFGVRCARRGAAGTAAPRRTGAVDVGLAHVRSSLVHRLIRP
jgi:hypothetical protein